MSEQKYIVERTNLKIGWGKNGTYKTQTSFSYNEDAVNYILTEVFNTNMSYEAWENSDDYCGYYAFEKDGKLHIHYYDWDSELLGLEHINTLKELKTFISDHNLLELKRIDETYQIKHITCNSLKRYFVNHRDHMNHLNYQDGFDSLEEAVDNIMTKTFSIDKSCEYTPEYNNSYYYVKEYDGKLYYLNTSDEIHSYTKYNTLFDESMYASVPKNISELKKWFRDLKSCQLGWADRGSVTIEISELYV
jgi:hypothetical protein